MLSLGTCCQYLFHKFPKAIYSTSGARDNAMETHENYCFLALGNLALSGSGFGSQHDKMDNEIIRIIIHLPTITSIIELLYLSRDNESRSRAFSKNHYSLAFSNTRLGLVQTRLPSQKCQESGKCISYVNVVTILVY